jgi:hypothetical protein
MRVPKLMPARCAASQTAASQPLIQGDNPRSIVRKQAETKMQPAGHADSLTAIRHFSPIVVRRCTPMRADRK